MSDSSIATQNPHEEWMTRLWLEFPDGGNYYDLCIILLKAYNIGYIKGLVDDVRKIYMSYEVQKDCLRFMDDFVFGVL